MNKRVQNIKKSLVNVFKKIRHEKQETATIKHTTIIFTQTTTTTTCASSSASSSSGVLSDYESLKRQTSSSCFTTNSDLCDIQSKNDIDESIDTQQLELNIINLILTHQDEYLNLLNYGLENYIRPLSALIDTQLYFDIFQNIEKIFSTSNYLRNSIIQSYQITNDIYESTVLVLQENIGIIKSIYETYLNGYEKSCACIKNAKIQEFISLLNQKTNCNFDLATFISLPLSNLNQLIQSFDSLLEIKVLNDDTNEFLANICENLNELKSQKKQNKKTSKRRNQRPKMRTLQLINSTESLDYVDNSNGLKYYFV